MSKKNMWVAADFAVVPDKTAGVVCSFSGGGPVDPNTGATKPPPLQILRGWRIKPKEQQDDDRD